VFSNKRQQTASEVESRHQIIREVFFEYAKSKDVELKAKDTRRSYSEAERIKIYRRDNGRCQKCMKESKPDRECIVPWSEYDADHVIPHVRGGETSVPNAQVLCRTHNRQKGARTPERRAQRAG
jgi:5-methylcytosine-specific restriction endonuclease McrA